MYFTMKPENISLLIMSIVLAVLGIMLLLGKADFAIKRHIRESGRYIMSRLRVIYAITLFIVSVVTTLLLCGANEIIAPCVIIPVAVIMMVLQNTWAKSK